MTGEKGRAQIIEDVATGVVVPVDRTAALVTGAGVHFEPKKNVFWSKQRPNVRQPLRGDHSITGKVFGRLTVLGLLAAVSRNGENNRKHNDREYRINTGRRCASWAVSCACGAYDAFKYRSLVSGRVTMCSACDYVDYLKRRTP